MTTARSKRSTRLAANAQLRAAFSDLYFELRRRGHEVVISYDDPGNPYYIPAICELDGLAFVNKNERRFAFDPGEEPQLIFFVDPYYNNVRGTYVGYHWGLEYQPSRTAREGYSQKKKTRSQRGCSAKLLGAVALADWVEKVFDVEKRARALFHEHRNRVAGLNRS